MHKRVARCPKCGKMVKFIIQNDGWYVFEHLPKCDYWECGFIKNRGDEIDES